MNPSCIKSWQWYKSRMLHLWCPTTSKKPKGSVNCKNIGWRRGPFTLTWNTVVPQTWNTFAEATAGLRRTFHLIYLIFHSNMKHSCSADMQYICENDSCGKRLNCSPTSTLDYTLLSFPPCWLEYSTVNEQLWMVTWESWDTTGVDLVRASAEVLDSCVKLKCHWGDRANTITSYAWLFLLV